MGLYRLYRAIQAILGSYSENIQKLDTTSMKEKQMEGNMEHDMGHWGYVVVYLNLWFPKTGLPSWRFKNKDYSIWGLCRAPF